MTITAWNDLIQLELAIVKSQERHSHLGFPQPSWIGKNYQTGGILVVGINPGNGNLSDGADLAEVAIQNAIEKFSLSGAIEDYHAYVNEVHKQVATWARWQRFGEALLQGLNLRIDEIGWLNSWKYRTESGSPDWSTPDFKRHIQRFLFNEIDALRPTFIVTHGGWAKFAIETFNTTAHLKIRTKDIPQRGSGSSQRDAVLLGQQIREGYMP